MHIKRLEPVISLERRARGPAPASRFESLHSSRSHVKGKSPKIASAQMLQYDRQRQTGGFSGNELLVPRVTMDNFSDAAKKGK